MLASGAFAMRRTEQKRGGCMAPSQFLCAAGFRNARIGRHDERKHHRRGAPR